MTDNDTSKSGLKKAYTVLPRSFKERVLGFMMRVVDHFLKSEPFVRECGKVLRGNRASVSALLSDVMPESVGSAGRAPAWLKDYIDRRVVEDMAFAAEVPSMPEHPVCSVVIPVFNKDYLTYRCLRSLFTTEVATPFEVVVVDNASSDSTGLVLGLFAGRIRVITNTENLGFVDACNQGAAESMGENIVFLNNDTEVADGWLDRMVETLGHTENVGAVGAKLVYPDGTLQEAGGIIFRDASGANYGNGGRPSDPRYSYLREVDYCSGACLLVRRELFERLGGFDPRYAPAYYEDTDLCFGLRKLGYRVLYQPMCEITHFEGATAGKDVESGFKRFQKINRVKFLEKWKDELAKQKEKGTRHIDACDRRTGPRLLFIENRPPKFDHDSGSLRLYTMLRMLSSMGARVSFMLRTPVSYDEYAMKLGGVGVSIVPEHVAMERLAEGGYDAAVISRVNIAAHYLPKVREAAPGIPVAFDTVDVHFIREMRMAEVEGDAELKAKAEKTREREMGIARKCDLTIAITDADREHLLAEEPSLKVGIITNIHEPTGVRPSLEGRDALMFIGGFVHLPNIDAMKFFCGDVLPLIRKRVPEAEMLIVGSHPTEEVRALEGGGVTVTGFVPETAPYFARSRVFVSPLRYGAGMKGKIGEAMSHGVPVVTTSIGAEGMGLVDGENALVADTPEEFAEAVVRLYEDDGLWQRIAEAGVRHVEEKFSPGAVRDSVRVLMDFWKK